MARSYKRKPFFYIACGRTKSDKIQANKMFRHITKNLMISYNEYTVLPKRLKEVSNVWSWGVDGPKYFWKNAQPKDMRK